MELSQLKQFLVIANAATPSQAAERLQVSPSAISKTISSLESSLGVPLFDKIRGRLVLNSAGEEFRLHATKSISYLEQAIKNAQRISAGEISRINYSRSDDWLFDDFLIEAFRKAYPKIHIRANTVSIEELYSLVLENKIDFGIATEWTEDPHLHCLEIYSEPMCIQSLKPLDNDAGRICLSKLNNLSFLVSNKQTGIWSRFVRACKQVGVVPKAAYYGFSTDNAFSIMKRTHCAKILPYQMTYMRYGTRSNCFEYFIDSDDCEIRYYLIQNPENMDFWYDKQIASIITNQFSP